jgi:hypothetical protein
MAPISEGILIDVAVESAEDICLKEDGEGPDAGTSDPSMPMPYTASNLTRVAPTAMAGHAESAAKAAHSAGMSVPEDRALAWNQHGQHDVIYAHPGRRRP